MKTVFVLLDSLNRNAMSCYGDTSVYTPNFSRFAERCVTFDNHCVGSLPCIPARRDLHTGRLNFLHRSWGPLEPFDDSFPEILKHSGTYSHIVTDHHHYFADGAATYHPRYSTWELARGQAIDKWKAEVNADMAALRTGFHPMQHNRTNYMINRQYMIDEDQYSGPQTFAMAQEFLNKNHAQENWFLQLECFDPHEPFHAPARFREHYPTDYKGPILDWPHYERVTESPEEIAEMRANYAALVTMCDEYFGQVLDFFDANDLWKDTCLILTTDHGFLLGEHDWWAKNRMPVYDEIARIPLMISHPDFANQAGTRRSALTQSIDIMPTILSLHDKECPPDVMGHSLIPILEGDHDIRDAAIFGLFGGACNVTDGRYVYHRYPESLSTEGLYEYTLMPTRMPSRVPVNDLVGATLMKGFSFTKGAPLLRIKPQSTKEGEAAGNQGQSFEDTATCLYDLIEDPNQTQAISDTKTEARLVEEMTKIMRQADAPSEMYERLDLA